VAFTENLDQFFDTDDFGVTATLTPSGGSAATINGIFADDYIADDSDRMVPVSSSTPVFQCKTNDVSNAYNGSLVVSGATYRIIEVKPDGTGTTMLVLEDQS